MGSEADAEAFVVRMAAEFERLDPLFFAPDVSDEEFERRWTEQAVPFLEKAMHPELELRSHLIEAEGGHAYRGFEGARRFADDVRASFSEFRRHLEEIVQISPGSVLFRQRTHLVGRGSGAELDVTGWVLIELELGRALRIESFLDREEALAAAEGR